MQLTAYRKFWICVVLVGIPGMAHAVNLSRWVDPLGKEVILWDFAVSATIPYVLLMFIFLAHCARYERKRAKSALPVFQHAACWGAAAAWGAMLWYSLLMMESLSTPQRLSSTMGIAAFLTPFIYMPFLALPYLVGSLAGGIYSRRIASAVAEESSADATIGPGIECLEFLRERATAPAAESLAPRDESGFLDTRLLRYLLETESVASPGSRAAY